MPKAKMHQIRSKAEASSRTQLGSLQRTPGPLYEFKGATLWEGKKREGKKGGEGGTRKEGKERG